MVTRRRKRHATSRPHRWLDAFAPSDRIRLSNGWTCAYRMTLSSESETLMPSLSSRNFSCRSFFLSTSTSAAVGSGGAARGKDLGQ